MMYFTLCLLHSELQHSYYTPNGPLVSSRSYVSYNTYSVYFLKNSFPSSSVLKGEVLHIGQRVDKDTWILSSKPV